MIHTSHRKALYPGSFDPVTFGHLDLIDRALEIFDEVHVAVAINREKKSLFTVKERLLMITKALGHAKRVRVASFDGLIVDYAKNHKIGTLIRGLRATSDFDYEFQMALTNRMLVSQIDTIFLMPSQSHFYLSSKLVKEIAQFGGDVRKFVPAFVAKLLIDKMKNR